MQRRPQYTEKRLLDVGSLQFYLSMGKEFAERFATDAGARRKIGKRTLYDKRVLDEALDRMSEDSLKTNEGMTEKNIRAM